MHCCREGGREGNCKSDFLSLVMSLECPKWFLLYTMGGKVFPISKCWKMRVASYNVVFLWYEKGIYVIFMKFALFTYIQAEHIGSKSAYGEQAANLLILHQVSRDSDCTPKFFCFNQLKVHSPSLPPSSFPPSVQTQSYAFDSAGLQRATMPPTKTLWGVTSTDTDGRQTLHENTSHDLLNFTVF